MQEAKQHLQNGGDADDESDGLLDGEQGGDLGSEDDDVEDVTDDYLNRLTGQVPGHSRCWVGSRFTETWHAPHTIQADRRSSAFEQSRQTALPPSSAPGGRHACFDTMQRLWLPVGLAQLSCRGVRQPGLSCCRLSRLACPGGLVMLDSFGHVHSAATFLQLTC